MNGRKVRGRTPWPSQTSNADDAREQLAPRQQAPYTCDGGHVFEITFLAGIDPPATWDCRCGQAAGLGSEPPAESQLARRMGQVRQRRSDHDLEDMLAGRIAELRRART
jgi:hypothetical protein